MIEINGNRQEGLMMANDGHSRHTTKPIWIKYRQHTHTHNHIIGKQRASRWVEERVAISEAKKSNENILIQLGTLWLDPIQSAFDTINIFCHIRRMFIIVVVVGWRRDAAYTRFYSGQIKIMLFILAVGNVDVIFISLMAFRCVYFVTVSTIAVDAVFVIVHAFMPCQNGIGHNCWCALWLSLVNLIEPFNGLFCFYMYYVLATFDDVI